MSREFTRVGKRSPVYVSKLLSLMLRHRPEEFGVAVDRYGFADLEAVVCALQERDAHLRLNDIESVVYDSEKQRFEIVEGRIRARYGHSFEIDLGIDPVEPPEYLYKGVHLREADGVLAEGLKPVDRQYVHLSFQADVAARLAGKGRGRGAVVRVDAQRAHRAGVPFYDCGPTILTPEVPSDFLILEQLPEASEMSLTRPTTQRDVAAPQGEPMYGRKRRFGQKR